MKNKMLEQICMNLQNLNEDVSVPRNIRRGAKEARDILMNSEESIDVKVASAISILDELVNDPNVPIHGRTAIWSIMSQLESLSSIKG
ncbi:MAG: hypothetical protein DRN33_02045 [Thermoplasmata archaeon]|jgi:uncharacterized protein (UPF0147 family)|nr:MAG: UPF0147 family protein [Thermoplasmata archaeon]RLF64532.1 MAG: hypothetical protein DRN33_02045 [Thermoplasmata archaeon]